jgi:magnesium-transporting ATPase (P-type)
MCTRLHALQVIQTRFYGKEKVRAVVLRTGFLTAKGSLVRSILYPPPADFRFDQDSYKFIGILTAIAAVGFLYALVLKVKPPFRANRQSRPVSPYIHCADTGQVALARVTHDTAADEGGRSVTEGTSIGRG